MCDVDDTDIYPLDAFGEAIMPILIEEDSDINCSKMEQRDVNHATAKAQEGQILNHDLSCAEEPIKINRKKCVYRVLETTCQP